MYATYFAGSLAKPAKVLLQTTRNTVCTSTVAYTGPPHIPNFARTWASKSTHLNTYSLSFSGYDTRQHTLPSPVPTLLARWYTTTFSKTSKKSSASQKSYNRIQQETPFFLFDLKYVAQLYIMSIRCRYPKVRREAIGILLLRPYREGVGDSIVTGYMTIAIIKLEEEGMVGDYIPEKSRVRWTLMKFNLSRRAGMLKCFLNTDRRLVIKVRDVRW